MGVDRLYPAYTLAELEARVKKATDPDTRRKMEGEIAARKAGTSKPKVTPQIGGLGAKDSGGSKGETTQRFAALAHGIQSLSDRLDAIVARRAPPKAKEQVERILGRRSA